jgi:hypothetical protein
MYCYVKCMGINLLLFMLYFSQYGNKYIIILEDLYLGLEYGLCARDLRQPSYCLMDRKI